LAAIVFNLGHEKKIYIHFCQKKQNIRCFFSRHRSYYWDVFCSTIHS